MDKNKFTRDPHLDAEGFTVSDARCVGCGPHEMCPRSGHCERYDSPLRYMSEWHDRGKVLMSIEQVREWNAHSDTLMTLANAHLDGINLSNPPWSYSDEALEAMHRQWMQGHISAQDLQDRRQTQRRANRDSVMDRRA